VAATIDPASLRHGRVRGRYFRENFAQAGIDLAQIVPELVTNADAAIAAAGRDRARIHLRFGAPDPDFVRKWKREMRGLRVPALLDWRHEVVCTDDGEGVDAATVDARLGALGVVPETVGQRGLFGRGLRDVWLAQGGGRIQGIRGGRAVESWFFPADGDEPYTYVHVRDEPATKELRSSFGIEREGTRVTVPLAVRLPANARLRRVVADLVQLRPIVEDPDRELYLELPGEPLELVGYSPPEPDPERPVLFDKEIKLQRGVSARVVVRRAAQPIALSPSRATRRGGLVVRSGRAAHETTSAAPGSRLSVFAEAGGHEAELVVLVVRHHASGWVREIARKDEDAQVEAEFDAETGVVTVYEGRREFKALERAARRAELPKTRLREYLPYRMLEVEVAANAVYAWAAERILERRLPGERPSDPAEYAGAVRMAAQELRYQSHERLMRGFLGPEVFEGSVTIVRKPQADVEQLRLVSG
jgi:hypothetical protein